MDDLRLGVWSKIDAQGMVTASMANTLFKTPSRYEASAVDDELLLIDVDSGKFFALKEVGLRIWNLLDDESDLDLIASQLCEEYEVAPDHARQSVASFADSLVSAGFARFQ